MPAVKMKVKLLRVTPEPEEMVALSAKLCYSASAIEDLAARVSAQDQSRFIHSLLESGHESPLEHAIFTFGIEGISRACSHQLVRHRLASYSQQSQRYVGAKREDGATCDYVIPPSFRAAGREAWFTERMRQIQQWYNEAAEALGGDREGTNEDARFLLPQAAATKIVVTMNARELMHFFSQRCCNRAQWEIRTLAWTMLRLAGGVAPALFALAGPGCVRGRCPEGKFSCGRAVEVRKWQRKILGK